MFKKSVWLVIFIIIVTGLLIIGCNMLSSASTNSGINQNLAVKQLTIAAHNGNHNFEVELAVNDTQRKIGLMNRNNLDESKGMLFIFEKQGLLDFWMKNTLTSLDMLFINENGVIEHIVHNASPCSNEPCQLYNSQKVVRYVLEINGGVADRFGLKEGDRVSW